MTFPTYGSVFACILLSSVFMIVVCLLGNRINFILKNSANLLVFFIVWILISFMYICKLIYTQIQFNRFLSILVPDNSNKIEKAYKSVQNNKNYKFEKRRL